MTSDCSSIDDLRVRLAIYASEYRLGEFRWLYRCCELALRALEQGNYGVGAVLVDGIVTYWLRLVIRCLVRGLIRQPMQR